MKEKLAFEIVNAKEKDRQWLIKYVSENWGSSKIVSRGKVHQVEELPALIAKTLDGEYVGLLCYRIDSDECEVVVLESLKENCGVGTALMERVQSIAKEARCKRVWLITTNDNLHALKFYQKRGYSLVAVYRNAVEEARRFKPQIPLIGNDGIPVRDEIELEMIL
ncbi:acetyltransferase [Anoxybacter fermentans]|uniref:Acetyltransferase n=1 Tax=Anoxybacter fermentans TaxID=1323375 RepID=A0A3Q9HNT5_9FIRM|nr:GNAT family N-acetyltransferase [Anoxybacter fermentans]AZR72067.1 acetyltransferase [Anoxybacter fermentans]